MSRPVARRVGAASPSVVLTLAGICAASPAALAQNAPSGALPPVEVEQSAPAAKPKAPSLATKQARKAGPVVGETPAPAAAPAGTGPTDGASTTRDPYAIVAPGTRSGSLGVPTAAEARADIQRTPGGVDVVPAEEYKDSTPARTIKDALDYVPGVFVQPKWGEDSRLSIRGSGLSRNFHGRGVYLLMDGVIPVTTADGASDFQEIDPTAYRYIEVYKGANALQYGANSLGGAINFVIPTGYDSDLFVARVDIGSFGLIKTSVSSGAVSGATDYFITGTWQQQDGFRDHSAGDSERGSANVGFRLSEDVETRLYVNANRIRQDIPGAVTREEALTNPGGAFVRELEPVIPNLGRGNDNVDRDYERNLDTVRVANRTTVRVQDGTLFEFGGFHMDRHLDHPIFRVIDSETTDYGAFTRFVDDNMYAGVRNRLVAGVTVHNGETRARQYLNVLGDRGALFSDADQASRNTSVYAENSLFVVPAVALGGGLQYTYASREQERNAGSVSAGRADFDFWSPKAGLLWEPARTWQVFANVSRSGEAPTFSEITITGAGTTALDPQEATTYEIGTRGNHPGLRWDLALYRSNIENEFQCLAVGSTGTCTQVNLDRSIHQGVEAGVAARLLSGLAETGPLSDEVWLNAAYTFSDFRFDDDPVFGDNELPGAPRHYLRAELVYKHSSGVYFGPNVEWVPEAYYVDSANTLETKAYALLGAKLGFDDGGQWSAYIEGRNLTDEAYIASAIIATTADQTSTLFEPGNGRAVYGGMQVRW